MAPRLERYELLSPIARGGMGTVYRARDRNTGEVCALKCVTIDHRKHSRVHIEGLQREFQILKGLRHPRIIRVFDYGLLDDGAYYTMELLGGEDMRSGAPFDWRQTCQYLHDIATCLSLLHARRLIHRDLSPGNVKRTGDGHCKLIDFGALASFGRTETVIGTPPFIAPEVVEVGRLDQRVDLYALGALGYFCLTGKHAYPAASIDQLPEVWKTRPPAPHVLRPGLPRPLSELIMDLLREDALARPASASEVITKLEALAELESEDTTAQRTLVQSFFAAPTYVGRKRELRLLQRAIGQARGGVGSAVRVVAPSGSGRTRLLDEVAVRAQLAGAAVLRADASVHPGRYGTVRALCTSMLDEMPRVARQCGRPYQAIIAGMADASLDQAIRALSNADETGQWKPGRASRVPSVRPDPPRAENPPRAVRISSAPPRPGKNLEQWFIDVSRERALVLLVDNVECADDGSVGVLLGLARAAPHQRVLLVCTEAPISAEGQAFGLETLRQATDELSLGPLTAADTEHLMRSMFGDAPRVERLAEWLHAETAGSPLHCLGLVRDLTARGEIRHERGAWVLPSSRPDTHASEDLEDWLVRRVQELTPESRELVRALCLNRLDTTVDLCTALTADRTETSLGIILDELAFHDILYWDQGKFVFSSAALRQAVLRRMDASVRRAAHFRLGVAIEKLAFETERALRLEAGFHLIQGGEEIRGAEMIADATKDAVACNMLVANLHHIGTAVEAALQVYRRVRRSRRERLPLLTVLAMAGYYEHYHWADRYGDDALDIVEEVSGLGTARRLRRWLGAPMAFVVGVGLALLRHYATPRDRRVGSFVDLWAHICGTMTALCGIAAISLDADRCDRVAKVLSPVAWLPRRMGLVAIYEFCRGLQYIAREDPAQAFAVFDRLAAGFSDPDHYVLLPQPSRQIYVPACHFARGAFAMMRADGRAALESADEMDRSGLPLYAMIASQIRKLYYLNRGELGMAQLHRERVELHAARVGSAWQVELWEPVSLMPYYLATDDVVELSRIAHRVNAHAQEKPSMWRYRELSQLATKLQSNDEERIRYFLARLREETPREFIGWSTAWAAVARFYNRHGDPRRARQLCQEALDVMHDVDRDYVMLFLQLEIQTAVADAALGDVDAALARLDALIERHTASEHALALGLLHESRARIALGHGRRAEHAESLNEATRWLRGTGTPSLVAMADRLAALGLAPMMRARGEVGVDLITVERRS